MLLAVLGGKGEESHQVSEDNRQALAKCHSHQGWMSWLSRCLLRAMAIVNAPEPMGIACGGIQFNEPVAETPLWVQALPAPPLSQ